MTISARAFLLAVAFFLACPVMAQANIGEDLTQLRARYGGAKEVGGQMLFDHGGLSITVYFDGDRSAMEIFTRNASRPDQPDLSKEDIDHILNASSEGKTWNQAQGSSGKPTWVRSDNKLIARLSENSTGKADDASVLIIMLNAK
jgi:hypothetical protein